MGLVRLASRPMQMHSRSPCRIRARKRAFGWVSTERRDGPDRAGATETMLWRACSKAPSWAGRRRVWPSTDSLVAKEVNQIAGVEAVCFGDFHLGPQMKVTRLPGRNPGRLSNAKQYTPGKTPSGPTTTCISYRQEYNPVIKRPATAATRTAECRRACSNPPRSACRCAASPSPPSACRPSRG